MQKIAAHCAPPPPSKKNAGLAKVRLLSEDAVRSDAIGTSPLAVGHSHAPASSAEVGGRALLATLFLVKSIGTLLLGLAIVLIPGVIGTGFPLYLSKTLADDPIAVDYIRAAATALAMGGLGGIPTALYNRSVLVFASIFNSIALSIQASIAYSLGILPLSLLVIVLATDLGSSLVAVAITYVFPDAIPVDKRALLWAVKAPAVRSARSYAVEVEGYALMTFYLLLSLPWVGRAFVAANSERLGFVDDGINDLSGPCLEMFSIATFWLASMYWFYVPAARSMSLGTLRSARLQRIVLLMLVAYVHFTGGDAVDHRNLFYTIGLLAALFLGLDYYCTFYDGIFSGYANEDPDAETKLRATEHTLYHQDGLSTPARWVTISAAAQFLFTAVWTLLSSSGMPFLFPKVLPGVAAVAYKIHVQDVLVCFLNALVGLVLLPLIPSSDAAGQRLHALVAFFVPLVSWWYSLQTKLLMHMQGGSPFLPSWLAEGVGTTFTDIIADATTWGASVALNLILPITLLVIAHRIAPQPFAELASAKAIGETARPLRALMVQQMLAQVSLSNVWLLVASSGLPMPTQFLTSLIGIPALLPVNASVAEQINRYDLIGALFLVFVGAALPDCGPERLGVVKRAAPLVVGASWFYSLAVKIAAHAGTTPAFHRSWQDMFGTPTHASPAADVLSWLAFALLNFVALPYVTYAFWPCVSLTKMRGANPRFRQQTHVEVMHYNRTMVFQHALVFVWTAGVWALLTSSGLVWPLEALASANVQPPLQSYAKPNPAGWEHVHTQDMLLALQFGIVAIVLDYVPIKLTGAREKIVTNAQLALLTSWALSIWSKVMVNAIWNGAGSYGHWSYRSGDSTYAKEQGVLDICFVVACTLGYVVSPLFIFFTLRNAIGRFAHSLAIGKKHHVEEAVVENDLWSMWITLIGRLLVNTKAYHLMALLSRVFAPPEQQFLTVDRIAYAMQAPSKELRRKHFKEVEVSRDEHGWYYCSKVPDAIEKFQRTEILPAMAMHTLEKAPGTFLEIMRTRLFHAAPGWMSYTHLTDELFNDIFHSRFGAEVLRKPTAAERELVKSLLSKKGKYVIMRKSSTKARLEGAVKLVQVALSPLTPHLSHLTSHLSHLTSHTVTPHLSHRFVQAAGINFDKELTICDLSLFTKGCERKEHVFWVPDTKLFFSASSRGIDCVAIEFQHKDGSIEHYVDSGASDSDEWHFAKRLAATALITAHQLGVHLAHGHLLAESQVVLAYKHLTPTHWLFNWVEPLAGDVQFINETWGLEVIIYGTIMDMGPMTSPGLAKILENAKSLAFEGDLTWDLMERLKPEHSGVPEHCPFNYRFTARILQGYVRELATAVADKYWSPADKATINFLREVYWWKAPPNTVTKKDAIDWMTGFFMNASYRHDYSHDDYLWRIGHALPTVLMANPVPSDPSTYMPNKKIFSMSLQIAHSLQAGVIETPLEAYYYLVEGDADKDIRLAVDKFVSNVQGLLVLGGRHEHMNQCGSMTH